MSLRFAGLRLLTIGMFVYFTFVLPAICTAELVIENKGLYDVNVKPESLQNTDEVAEVVSYELLEVTDQVPAVPGNHFGVEFYVTGQMDASFDVEIAGHSGNSTGSNATVIRKVIPVRVQTGEKHYLGWRLKTADIGFTEWTFAFSHPYTKVCSFQLIPAAEGVSLEDPEPESSSVFHGVIRKYLIRDGIYTDLAQAKKRSEELKELGIHPFIFVRTAGPRKYVYHVFTGIYADKSKAKDGLEKFSGEVNSKAEIEEATITILPLAKQ